MQRPKVKIKKPQLKVQRPKSIKDLHPYKIFDTQIKKNIEYYGGDITDVYKTYKKSVRILIPAIIAVAILGVLKIHYLLYSVPLLALITYLYPFLYVKSKAEEHKKIVNNEAPFIALIAYIDSIVDKGLNFTLKELSEIKELKVPKIEKTYLMKMITYMNMPFSRALERRSIIHTGDMLGKLYSNYLASLELGFTLTDRLKDTLHDLLNDLKDTYKNYIEKAGEMTEMEFALLLLLPIILIGFSFSFKVSPIDLFAPLFSAPLLIYLVSSSQPSFDYNLKYGRYVFLLVIIPVILVLPKIDLTYKLIASVAVLVALSYFVYSQIKLAKDLENNLPTLLKEISEYLKIGYTIQTAIPKVKLSSKSVSKALEKYIKDPEHVDSPSKLFNMTFKLLFIIARTGYSSVALQELGNTIYEVVYGKNSLTRQLQLFDILTLMTPVMLWMTFTMLGKIASTVVPPFSVIASYSVASALIFSKISRFTLLYFPTMLMLFAILSVVAFIPPSIFNVPSY